MPVFMWGDMITEFLALLAKEGVSPLFVGILAAIAAIFGALASLIVSGRTVYINSVTVERSKWIEKLRNNLAKLSGNLILYHLIGRIENKTEAQQNTYDKAGVEFVELLSTLILQLNPNGKIDGNLIKIIIGVNDHTDDLEKLQPYHDLLIGHSQWLLKEEWEKVKAEASGPLSRLWWRWKRFRRMQKYDAYLRSEGSLNAIA